MLGWDAAVKQKKLDDSRADETAASEKPRRRKRSSRTTRLIDFDSRDFKGNPLWDVLVETARRNPLFANISGYAQTKILPGRPDIGIKELATVLSISVGEAMVILDDYRTPE